MDQPPALCLQNVSFPGPFQIPVTLALFLDVHFPRLNKSNGSCLWHWGGWPGCCNGTASSSVLHDTHERLLDNSCV